MNIVGQTRRFVTKRILSNVKPKHQKLFEFGIRALTFTPYDSLGSNARLVVENVYTASSKIYRLVSNKTILNNFPKLVSMSGFIKRSSLVNVDFSTFCGFQALCFGVQTGKGRCIPVWNNCITYPITFVGSQNLFVLEEIKKIGKCFGFYPRFVFDRGFWIPVLMKFMLKRKIIFYLRIKQGQELTWVTKNETRIYKAKKIGKYTKDAVITLFCCKMRLIISPPPPIQINPKKEQNTQRWYIITNDMDSLREDILKIYRTRFEIEEVFKDYKHIQKLKILHIKEKKTFTVLLWFATLAFWLAWWIKGSKPIDNINPKKKLSFFRIFWEELQRSMRRKQLSLLVSESG
jgi:DDE family transposase